MEILLCPEEHRIYLIRANGNGGEVCQRRLQSSQSIYTIRQSNLHRLNSATIYRKDFEHNPQSTKLLTTIYGSLKILLKPIKRNFFIRWETIHRKKWDSLINPRFLSEIYVWAKISSKKINRFFSIKFLNKLLDKEKWHNFKLFHWKLSSYCNKFIKTLENFY